MNGIELYQNQDVLNKEQGEESLELAEDAFVDQNSKESVRNEFVEKRELLKKTKIVRQIWSIAEIYQKIKDGKLILDTEYQRQAIWGIDKKTAFIESLYMDIMIPPIYVVEIPGEDILDETKYEVVDGKQRLSSIYDFITGKFKLNERNLEYYADLFGGKVFLEVKHVEQEKTSQMLSSILDIYVITANSPEFTKYDIFARLNKGAEKLKVNEIRRAIYKSKVTGWITEFVNKNLAENKDQYGLVFTQNDIKRYEDYGRFYKSIAFYVRTNIDAECVENYNSRPRDMINVVLQDIQKDKIRLDKDEVIKILDVTLWLKYKFGDMQYADYIIDTIIPFIKEFDVKGNAEKVKKVFEDTEVRETLDKSPATTSNVNARLSIVKRLITGETK